MNYSAQKAALTRVINSGNKAKLVAVCRKAVKEWNADYWPDDWTRWQRALDDALGYLAPTLESLDYSEDAERQRLYEKYGDERLRG